MPLCTSGPALTRDSTPAEGVDEGVAPPALAAVSPDEDAHAVPAHLLLPLHASRLSRTAIEARVSCSRPQASPSLLVCGRRNGSPPRFPRPPLSHDRGLAGAARQASLDCLRACVMRRHHADHGCVNVRGKAHGKLPARPPCFQWLQSLVPPPGLAHRGQVPVGRRRDFAQPRPHRHASKCRVYWAQQPPPYTRRFARARAGAAPLPLPPCHHLRRLFPPSASLDPRHQ